MRRIDDWLEEHDLLLTRITWIGVVLAISYFAGSVALR